MNKTLITTLGLAIAAPVLANTAPVTTNLGYQFGLTNQQAFDVDLLNPATSDYDSPAHSPQQLMQHRLSASTSANEHVGLFLDYRLGRYQGNGVHTIYRDVDVTSATAWTSQVQFNTEGEPQAVIRGIAGEAGTEDEHDVALQGRFYGDNVVAGLTGNFLRNPGKEVVGADFDIAFDGNKDQLVYSMGIGYQYGTLSSLFDPARPTAQQVVLVEADDSLVHTIAASQSLTIALNKKIKWRFGAGIDASIGYLSNPYASVAIRCGEGCHDDKSTEVDESQFASDAVVDYRTELLPESRIGWHVHSNYRQYIESANAALQLDLRYAGDNWGLQQGMGRLAWAQRFDIATDRSTGFWRWLERQDTSLRLTPFGRLSGQYKSSYFTQMTDPELTQAINDSENLNFEGKKESNMPAAVVSFNGTDFAFTQANYFTSNPKYASFLAYSLGINGQIEIADVALSLGFEMYRSESQIAGQVAIPGLSNFALVTAGIDYKF